ncbi:MAG: creatininase family protein [Victivallales bacterium]|jgi:creatinine amidohydrolase
MRYKKMLPYQLREAIEKNVPVVLPLGVLEYHAEHLPLGVDTTVVEIILERLEAKHPEMVLMPAFCYGSASYAVADAVSKGSVEIDSMAVCRFAEELFRSLLEIGFRNIHGFIFHQSENFVQGMPTDLAFRFAARRSLFAFFEKRDGRGWWGDESMKNYCEGNNPFDYIRIHPLDNAEISRKYPPDHAGKMETSLMLALAPGQVDMTHFSPALWFARDALDASAEYGEDITGIYLDNIERILFDGSNCRAVKN